MRVDAVAVRPGDGKRGADVSIAALLQVGLEQQALHLAALVVLLGLDLVEGQLQDAGGSEPGLEQGELESGWSVAGGMGGCDSHILTVYLP